MFAATATVFFRDLESATGILLRIGFYLCPIMYSTRFVPEPYRELYLYNPLACLFALLQWSVLGTPAPQSGPLFFMFASFAVVIVCAHYAYDVGKRRFTKAF